MKKIKPKEGQESVWDYPRPPAIEEVSDHIRIIAFDTIILDANNSFRILETSHPPTYYLPVKSFKNCSIEESRKTSFCEFKGQASYYDLKVGNEIIESFGWGYKKPNNNYSQIKNHICVYAHKVDSCYVNDERVQAQEGDYYGGWITSKIVGPFKGATGTWGW